MLQQHFMFISSRSHSSNINRYHPASHLPPLQLLSWAKVGSMGTSLPRFAMRPEGEQEED
jgi:hypothetical protein